MYTTTEEKIRQFVRDEMMRKDMRDFYFNHIFGNGPPINKSDCKAIAENKFNEMIPSILDKMKRDNENLKYKIKDEIIKEVYPIIKSETKAIVASESGIKKLLDEYKSESNVLMNQHTNKLSTISNDLIESTNNKMEKNIEITIDSLLENDEKSKVFRDIKNNLIDDNKTNFALLEKKLEYEKDLILKENQKLRKQLDKSNTKTILFSTLISFGISCIGTFIGYQVSTSLRK